MPYDNVVRSLHFLFHYPYTIREALNPGCGRPRCYNLKKWRGYFKLVFITIIIPNIIVIIITIRSIIMTTGQFITAITIILTIIITAIITIILLWLYYYGYPCFWAGRHQLQNN